MALAKNSELQQAQQLEIFAAEARRAKLEVEKSTIFAPKTGIIGEDLARQGESISGQIVATMTVIDPMRIEAFVPVGAIDGIENASFVIDGNDIAADEIRFDYLAPTANLSAGTISAFFELSDRSVTPGQSCKLRLSNS